MKRTITIPDGVVEEIDQYIKEVKKHTTRSQFVTDACKEKLLREKQKTA